jgi:hypothetical protein
LPFSSTYPFNLAKVIRIFLSFAACSGFSTKEFFASIIALVSLVTLNLFS